MPTIKTKKPVKAKARKTVSKVEKQADDDLDEMPEWTDEDFKRARPAKDVLPPALYEALIRKRGQRGPQKAPVKRLTSLRLDPDIIAYYKSTGPGWQAKINAALRGTLPG